MDYYDLGIHTRTISTTSANGQRRFDRGLVWAYASNHEEAARCFEKAIDADTACAMAYWGLAYAAGPNYNKPWEFFSETDLVTTVERTHRGGSRRQGSRRLR
jgi:tetratricopeptide (TPR) repeat protein